MSDNYDRMAEFGRKLFLEWDQDAVIGRLDLEHDDSYIYIRYLSRPYRIERTTGAVAGEGAVEPTHILTIYDYICRDAPLPAFKGELRGTRSVRGVPSGSPDAAEMSRPTAVRLEKRIGEVRAAMEKLGFAPFPQGDAACRIPVFDRMEAVFQLWEGDEEFPPQVRFLWDEYALSYLRFETLHYVMGDFIALLESTMNALTEM